MNEHISNTYYKTIIMPDLKTAEKYKKNQYKLLILNKFTI